MQLVVLLAALALTALMWSSRNEAYGFDRAKMLLDDPGVSETREIIIRSRL